MYQQQSFRFGSPISDRVKTFIIIMVVVFVIQKIGRIFLLEDFLIHFFALSHEGLVYKFRIWQLFTYIFLHGNFFHILFNCFGLWMFGSDLERLWGPKRFTNYFILSGIGAGVFIALLNAFMYGRSGGYQYTFGASGVVYAMLLAYGMTWPNREILLFFLIPIQMKYFVIIFGAVEFFGTIDMVAGVSGNISHIGHLGGLITGFLLLYLYRQGKFSLGVKEKISGKIKKERVKKKKAVIEQRIKAKKIIDKMLDKIAKSGMDSLTPDEKRDLEWARRHYYPNDNDTIH